MSLDTFQTPLRKLGRLPSIDYPSLRIVLIKRRFLMASKALQSVAVTLSVGKKTYAANVTKPTTPSRHAVIVTHGAGGDMDSADLGKLAESFASHGAPATTPL